MKRRVVMELVLLLLVPTLAFGQELAGTITGSVKDPQGLVIPGAQVTARHLDTNITYQATTGGQGRFVIPRVRLGKYTITVESPGFRRAVVRNLDVQVGTAADVNITLQIGEVQEEVTVTADVSQEIVDTTSASLGAVVSERQVLELPLNGRNATELVFLQAGTYYETDADGMGDKLLIHGQRHRSLNFSLDGIDTQDNLNRASSIMVNQPLLNMTAENVQEFQVATGISSAEFSRGGAQVSAVTRSGGNTFHGSAFWFHRNTVFDANDFFNNIAGQERPPLLRHQFGGRIGGPIWKDKAFFFFGYQQTREKRGIPVHRVVWSDDARQGIFKYVDSSGTVRSVNLLECGANVQAILGRDCVDSRFDLSSSIVSGSTLSRDPFILNNIIGNMPDANIAGGDGLNTLGYRFNSKTFTYEHLPSIRLDYRFNDKHLFYATWNYVDRNIAGDFINGREPIWPTLGALGNRLTLSNGFSGALLSNFTPTVVNEFRVGRVGGENAFVRNQPFNVDWVLDFDDISDVYSVDGGHGSFRDNVTLHVRDVLSMVKGRHQFKYGGEWRHRSVDVFSYAEIGDYGEIDFNDSDSPPGFSATNLRNMAGASSSPSSTDRNNAEELLNNLIGFIGQIETRYNVTSISDTTYGPPGTPEHRIFQNREMDLFFQDSWSVTSNLTLNLGLRWEWAGVPIETRGLILLPEGGADAVFGNSGPEGFFNPGTLTGKPCALPGTIPNPVGADIDMLSDLCSIQMVAGGSNNGRPLFDNDLNNFGPVLGVAWDPFGTGKTSVRAGYRLSYMQDVFSIIDGNVDDNAGLVLNHDCAPVGDGQCGNNVTLLRNVADGNGNIVLSGGSILRPAPSSFSLPTTVHILNTGDSALDYRTFADDLGTAFYQEWTLSLQREFLRNWAVDVRYVGTRGHNLRRVADYNEYNINALDPVTGQTFFEAFLIARNNLIVCNAAPGCSTSFDYNPAVTGSLPNPLMTDLISPEPARLLGDSDLQDQLMFGATGEWLDEYLIDRTSEPRPLSGTSNRRRGGAFFGLVLQGRLPLNFFNVNPFVASSRRMVGDGFSTYHALEVEFKRRPVAGFAFQASYTFQRAISDFDGDANELLNDTRPSSVINPRYTSGDIMPRHLITGNWIYELPFGRGKRFNPENSFLRESVSGWQFGGIVSWRSGRPLGFTSGLGMFHRTAISDNNTVNLAQGVSVGALRDLTGQLDITATDTNTGQPLPGIFWFDPCLSSQVNGNLTGGSCTADSNATQGLFTLPNPGELGQLPQTVIFGPRRFLLDFNLSKRTRLTETSELEFRWEVFNAFNNVNFQNPVTNIFDNDFGRIFRTVTRPREMQFALKVNF